MTVGATAPRLRITRLSPSRTSTVFKSLADISWMICSMSVTSIGPVARVVTDDALVAPLELDFDFGLAGRLLNVATLKGTVE
jgi:hypothetical protein